MSKESSRRRAALEPGNTRPYTIYTRHSNLSIPAMKIYLSRSMEEGGFKYSLDFETGHAAMALCRVDCVQKHVRTWNNLFTLWPTTSYCCTAHGFTYTAI